MDGVISIIGLSFGGWEEMGASPALFAAMVEQVVKPTDVGAEMKQTRELSLALGR